jgi:Holliday junction DNA helicase RuvA
VIGSLRGTILDRRLRAEHQGELLVEVGGVGYRVVVPGGALDRAGELAGDTFLHVHTYVREDAMVLYGFPSAEERSCFEILIGTHGVGPSVALALLSVHTPGALRRAVADNDLDALMLVPGIGKKTAARLVMELGPRLVEDYGDPPELMAADATRGGANRPEARSDVRAALAGLGYGPEEIRQVVAGLPAEGTAQDLLRSALRDLATSR